MIEDKVVQGRKRENDKRRETQGERDVVRMKSADQWIRTPLTTPHSWKVKRNIMQQRGLHLWELDMS